MLAKDTLAVAGAMDDQQKDDANSLFGAVGGESLIGPTLRERLFQQAREDISEVVADSVLEAQMASELNFLCKQT